MLDLVRSREAVISLVDLLCLVHLWIPFTGFIFGGTGSRDQGGINDRSLLHGHSPLLEVSLDRLKNLLAEVVLLKQMPECQDRRLIRDSIADQIDPRKAAYGRNLDQSIFHGWITEAVPLLHQVNPQHGGQWIRRAATFAAGLWVARLDQIKQGLPGGDLIHLGQELLLLGALFGGRLLVMSKPELLAAHHLNPGLGLYPYSRAISLGFPGSL